MFFRSDGIGVRRVEQCIRERHSLVDAVFLQTPQKGSNPFVTVLSADIFEGGPPLRPIGVEQRAHIHWRGRHFTHFMGNPEFAGATMLDQSSCGHSTRVNY